jgi:hypothetical protein
MVWSTAIGLGKACMSIRDFGGSIRDVSTTDVAATDS